MPLPLWLLPLLLGSLTCQRKAEELCNRYIKWVTLPFPLPSTGAGSCSRSTEVSILVGQGRRRKNKTR
nr:hypothetical protein Q903MT_gene1916 [Picea sitchensis]